MAIDSRNSFIKKPGGIPNNNPKIQQTVVHRGTANTEFRNISDSKELAEFIRNNPLIQKQDEELEIIRGIKTIEHDTEEKIASMPPIGKPKMSPQEAKQILDELRRSNPPPIQMSSPEEIAQEEKEVDNDDAELIEQLTEQMNLNNFSPEAKQRILSVELPKLKAQLLANPDFQAKPTITNQSNNAPITNIDPNAPSKPPDITVAQMRRQVELEMAEKLKKNLPLIEEPNILPKFVLGKANSQGKFNRIDLLSGGTFYDSDNDVQVRKINIFDAPKIRQAKTEENISEFIDAIGSTLDNVDIRDLTFPDFKHLLYWHQFNSFTSTPLIINWTSKYGNENVYKIEERSLKYVPNKMNRREFDQKYGKYGLCYPTLRDWEFLQKEQLTPEDLYLVQKAIYFKCKPNYSLQDKIDAMAKACEEDLGLIEKIPELLEDCQHYVNEQLDLTDAKFNPTNYLRDLKKQIEILEKEKSLFDPKIFSDVAEIQSITDQIGDITLEVESIEERLARKEAVLPDIETKILDMKILAFFPLL